MRDKIHTQPGIILKKIPYSESDEIILTLMRDDGLRRFFVAGSRKSRRRYQGIIDVFAHLNFQYSVSDKGLWRLQGADIVSGAAVFPTSNIEAYAFANFLSELICELAPEEVNDHQFYDLWVHLQDDIKSETFTRQKAIQCVMQVFSRSGYEITNRHCVLCDSVELDARVGFDQARGGVVCQACCGETETTFDRRLFDVMFSDVAEKAVTNVLMNKLVAFAQNIIQKPCRSATFYLSILRSGELV